MGQQSERKLDTWLNDDEFESPKKFKCEFSSNDDSSDSEEKSRKRPWKKNESIGKIRSHRKYLTQKFKPYIRKSIISSANSKHFKSEVDFVSDLPPTTIELKNVPPEMNNILRLYERFSQFGEITLIQINRNSDSRALISFKTVSEARRAMEKASSIIPYLRVSWFMDHCLIKRVAKKSATKNDSSCFTKNDNITYEEAVFKFNNADTFCNNLENIRDSHKKSGDVVNSISKLIKLKNKLLFNQLKSHNEIVDKLGKCAHGSDKEKTLLTLLKKVQEQIGENQRSIEHSLKQKTEMYYSKPKSRVSGDTHKDINQQQARSWTEVFKSSQACDGCGPDFIPINLLDYRISLDQSEFSSNGENMLDTEMSETQNYFSSRSFRHITHIRSPKNYN